MTKEIEKQKPIPTELVSVSEIDIQIKTAKGYPRDIKQSLAKAMVLVTMTQESADECIYSLPRGNKNITGASARFAETMASTWGNLRIRTRVVETTDKNVVCVAEIHDLENNSALSTEVRRRIIDKQGRRYNDDMIIMAANAGMSIAHRNAVLKVIPKPFWVRVYNAAERVVHGGKIPIGERKQKAVAYFVARGITEEKIFATLNVANVSKMSAEHLTILTGFRNAINEGAALETIFGTQAATEDELPEPVEVEFEKEAVVENKAEETESEILWGVWTKMRQKLSAEQLTNVRTVCEVKQIHASLPAATLTSMIEVAEMSLKEEKDEN